MQRSRFKDLKARIYKIFNRNILEEPVAKSLHSVIVQNLKTIRTRESKSVTLRYRAKDAEMASYILERLLREATTIVRAARLEEYRQRAASLREMLVKESRDEHRRAFIDLLSHYERRLMYVLGSNFYGILLIDPVVTSHDIASPRYVPWFVGAFAVWVFVTGFVIVLPRIISNFRLLD